MGKRSEEIVVGLDIGTTKTCAIVAEVTENGVDVIGIGDHESVGLRKGVVVNIDATVNSIQRAISEAERMAGVEISSVYANIAGAHITGFNSRGIVAIKDQEVTPADVERVIDAAKAVAMPMDREMVHILPQEYLIDECDGVREPVGMSGVRLEAKIHIVTAAKAALENIRRCTKRTDLYVSEIVLSQVAAAQAVLHDDEKELGVALVDIGGGTTDIAIYHNGGVVHTSVFPVGGSHVTADISCGLRTPKQEAERIKLAHGCALTSLVGPDETIEVPSVGGREPQVRSRQLLCEIIEPRVEELFRCVHDQLRNSGYEDLLASGVVITGGGAILPGMVELGEEVMGLPVRLGTPAAKVGGLSDVVRSPKFSTAVGLVLYGARREQQATVNSRRSSSSRAQGKGLLERMKIWVSQSF